MDGGFDFINLKNFFSLKPLKYSIMDEVISCFLLLILTFCILFTSSAKQRKHRMFENLRKINFLF